MQLKLNWLGRDSLLAAPAVLDLVRLVCHGASCQRTGLLSELSYFFKDPLFGLEDEKALHSTPDQFNLLLSFLRNNQQLVKVQGS
jgi:myo-inositol-1-phosphate synthase